VSTDLKFPSLYSNRRLLFFGRCFDDQTGGIHGYVTDEERGSEDRIYCPKDNAIASAIFDRLLRFYVFYRGGGGVSVKLPYYGNDKPDGAAAIRSPERRRDADLTKSWQAKILTNPASRR